MEGDNVGCGKGPVHVLTCCFVFVAICPDSFPASYADKSCYSVFTEEDDALSYFDAQDYCAGLHPLSKLVSIETDDEKQYIARLLAGQPGEN